MTWQFTEKENNLPVYAMIYLTTEKHILKQQDTEKQVRELTLPDFKTDCKATVIKAAWYLKRIDK